MKRAPLTYVIGTTTSQPVKIGTSADPKTRLQAFQTGQPVELTLMWTCDGDYERALHDRFAQYRVRGEWFDLTPLGNDPVGTVRQAVMELPHHRVTLNITEDQA